VIAPVGTGGTLAGLLVGCSIYWPGTTVFGIAVTGSAVPFSERIAVMANAAAELLDLHQNWTSADVRIETDYIGPGYSIPSEDGNTAIKTAARAEGMLLDPVYTGKAFAGILDCTKRGTIEPGSDVLFVHCGGSPALFPYADLLTQDKGA
jgi:1-aminocyclopropane-1-carboxylate deaminase/D-cysteine desulfhydrase-like pyridoxal-dependent ACC family enzyme